MVLLGADDLDYGWHMHRSALAIIVLCAAACGSSSSGHKDPSPGSMAEGGTVDSSPSAASATTAAASSKVTPGAGALEEVAATGDVLVFEGYDGPKGALRPLQSFAWTVVPLADASGKTPCTFGDMQLGRVQVVGKKGDLVVFALSEVPECHFAVPPALVLDDETGPLAAGAAILTSWKDGSHFARVEAVAGDTVSFVGSPFTAIETVFDEQKLAPRKIERAKVRSVKDGLTFGSRAVVPNGASMSMVTLFAATSDAVYAARPFGTKYLKADVAPGLFEAPLDVGASVFVLDPNGGFMRGGTVKRAKLSVMYEVAWNKGGGTVTAGFEDVVRPPLKK